VLNRADWEEPGAFEVMPGVYRIPLPLPNDALRTVNVYAIVSSAFITLIDAGWAIAETATALQSALASIGATLRDIRQVAVTHSHRDHYTFTAELKERFGVTVFLGKGEKPTLDVVMDPDHARLEPHIATLRSLGADELADRIAVTRNQAPLTAGWHLPDKWLADGYQIDAGRAILTALETPGHTRGHMIFLYSAGQAFFAGDHVLPHITPSIGYEPAPGRDPLVNYLRSLRKVRQIPDMQLLPAHGPVLDSSHKRIDELLDHHDDRLKACQAAVTSGLTTVPEIAGSLTWTRHKRALTELNAFNQMLAVLETLAHLEVLQAQGIVQSAIIQGIRHFEFV